MKKQSFFALLAMALVAFNANHAVAASSSTFDVADTQVVSDGTFLMGARGAFGGSTYFGLSSEYMFSKNFGAIVDVRRGSKSFEIGFGDIASDTSLKYWTVAAQASMHMDVLNVKNLDTYVSVGLARNFYGSAETTVTGPGTAGIAPIETSVNQSEFDFVANVNARYFFTENFAAHTSVGVGLGLFSIGADYMF